MTRLFIWLLLVLAALPHPAAAHDSQPFFVQIVEQSPQLFSVKTKLPPSLGDQPAPSVSLPPDCTYADGRKSDMPRAMTGLFRCEDGLHGRTVAVTFARYNPSLAIIFRFQPLSGPVLTQLQSPDQTVWHVPAANAARVAPVRDTAARYGALGVEHILLGFDHLLFVLCLVILAGCPKHILLAISGFTIAHTVTLGLAALGVVRPPTVVIEALIALSVLFLAMEIVRRDRTTVAWRHPIAVSMIFGLLHGFGFAAVLSEIGLPEDKELTALLMFNLGVEAGQIAFVVAIVLLLRLFRLLAASAHVSAQGRPFTGSAVIGYGVGSLAAFWLLERVALF